ncbi:MAG TPA: hypothetical protein VM890_04065 [Longimicrobium sp.]|nr:hypothetical protein [Longimicrobium sp.]
MRASLPFRVSALWALLVFAFGWGGDALVLHPCPHHSAISQPGAAAHAGHGGDHHAAASQDASDEHGTPSHAGCTCVVACAGAADALAAAPVDVRLATGASRLVHVASTSSGAVLPGRLAYVLPYPTAPPSVLS